MTTKGKISRVLEYLIHNDEAKAKELLHQVFIEKARAIHEELMGHDEDMEEMVSGTGDEGKDLTNDIKTMKDEIDFEETMSEDDLGEFKATADDEDEMELMGDDEDDDAGDMDMGDSDADTDGDFGGIEDKMHDLESALAELKAEFEKLEAEESGETASDEEGEEEEGEEEEGEEEEGEMEESWDLDEDFDDLAESLDLEVITKDMEKSQKSEEEVGRGRSGMAIDKNAKSPLPKSQTSRYGAKPVETGKGPTHNGYNLEAAPKSGMLPDMKADNRRKKSTDGASKMSKEGNGSAMLNKTKSEFGADTVGKMSPLSKGGDNLK